MKNKNTRYKMRQTPYRRIGIIALVLLFSGIILLALELKGITNFYTKKSSTTLNPNDDSQINYDPPTDQEIAETEQHKRSLDSQKREVKQTEKTSSSVTPIITSVDQNALRAYVSGISEEGGTCVATFRQDQYTFTKSSVAFSDINNTVCTPMDLSRSDFANTGEWAVSLKYQSSLVQGESQEVRFKVE